MSPEHLRVLIISDWVSLPSPLTCRLAQAAQKAPGLFWLPVRSWATHTLNGLSNYSNGRQVASCLKLRVRGAGSPPATLLSSHWRPAAAGWRWGLVWSPHSKEQWHTDYDNDENDNDNDNNNDNEDGCGVLTATDPQVGRTQDCRAVMGRLAPGPVSPPVSQPCSTLERSSSARISRPWQRETLTAPHS